MTQTAAKHCNAGPDCPPSPYVCDCLCQGCVEATENELAPYRKARLEGERKYMQDSMTLEARFVFAPPVDGKFMVTLEIPALANLALPVFYYVCISPGNEIQMGNFDQFGRAWLTHYGLGKYHFAISGTPLTGTTIEHKAPEKRPGARQINLADDD